MHSEIVRDGLDAIGVQRSALGLDLLRIRSDIASKGHDSLVHGNADVGRVDARLPVERVLHVLFEILVGHGFLLLSYLSAQSLRLGRSAMWNRCTFGCGGTMLTGPRGTFRPPRRPPTTHSVSSGSRARVSSKCRTKSNCSGSRAWK